MVMGSKTLVARVQQSSDMIADDLRQKLLEEAGSATDKLQFVYTLRQLSAHGEPIEKLISLAKSYNRTRAMPNYRVDKFVIESPDGSFGAVDINSGQVVTKKPY